MPPPLLQFGKYTDDRIICRPDQAIKDGVLTYNPVAEATIDKERAKKNTPSKGDDDFFNYDQALEFLRIIADMYSDPDDPDIKDPLYYAFYFALVYSQRRGEVLGLRWENVNLKNGTIHISHTVTKGTKINRSNTTKTPASERTYDITDELVDALYHLKKYEVKNRTLFGSNYIDNDYLVKKQDGSLYYPDTLSKIFRRIIQSHPEQPQNITLHGLRSSCVSILVHDGYDLKSIQDYVGHEDETTTLKIYAKVKSKESKKEITQDLSTKLPFYINNNN